MCKNCLKKDIQLNCIRIYDISDQINELIGYIKSKSNTNLDLVGEELEIIERLNKEVKDQLNVIESKIDSSKVFK